MDHLRYHFLCFSCFRICSLLPCGHLLGKGCHLGVFVTFPCGIQGQVGYLIASIPDLCHLSYFALFIYSSSEVVGCPFLENNSDGKIG